jgi:demethylmenaquinone methyltransferase/2-methoxy-6-polyprenyl-1,4-benzoquinol methylase
VSSYVYMKVLESTPLRYDRGIRILSRGAIDDVYRQTADLVAGPGKRVLDVGCGTGNLTLACAARGARVVGIDSNADMLDVARDKAKSLDGSERVVLVELDAMEIEDGFAPNSFDAAVSCLLFSELQVEERLYVLQTLRTRVRAGGIVAIADEVPPATPGARAWWRLLRAPLVAATWLLTQATTHYVEGLDALMSEAGLIDIESERMAGSFVLAYGTVPEHTAREETAREEGPC